MESEQGPKHVQPYVLLDYHHISDLADIPLLELKSRLDSVPHLKSNLQKADYESKLLRENLESLQQDHANNLDKAGKESESLREELLSLRQELANSRHGFIDQTDRRLDTDDNDDEGQGDDEVDDEPGIALEDQLRIKEQSAKAIEIYSNTLFSTVWQGCSKNTYGFFIRNVLLCGSRYKKQLVPETRYHLFLSALGVLTSAGMQFCLAWFLWSRLPSSYPEENGSGAKLKSYPGTEQRGYYDLPLGFARVPLPSYEYPNYLFANDVCRTVWIVQLICIALFLFSVLNNVPGVLKNLAIIWTSERFVSEDEEGITKLHYWRESSHSRASANYFLDELYDQYKKKWLEQIKMVKQKLKNPMPDAQSAIDKLEEQISSEENKSWIKAFLCEMYLKGSYLHSYEKQEEQEISDDDDEEEELKLDEDSDVKSFKQKKSEEAARAKQVKLREDMLHRLFSWEKVQFANAGRRRWMLPMFSSKMLPPQIRCKINQTEANEKMGQSNASNAQAASAKTQQPSRWGCFGKGDEERRIPRSIFEVSETRSFLAEALRLIDGGNNTKPVGSKDEIQNYVCRMSKLKKSDTATGHQPSDIGIPASISRGNEDGNTNNENTHTIDTDLDVVTFAIDGKVKAQYRDGCWYTATIRSVNTEQDSIVLEWDDEDKKDDLTKNTSSLRPCRSDAGNDTVTAVKQTFKFTYCDGRWKANVQLKNDGSRFQCKKPKKLCVSLRETEKKLEPMEFLHNMRRNRCRGELQEVQFCDQVRFNLVRLDYLRPSHSWLRPRVYELVEDQKYLGALKAEMEAVETRTRTELEEFNATVEVQHMHTELDNVRNIVEFADDIVKKFRELKHIAEINAEPAKKQIILKVVLKDLETNAMKEKRVLKIKEKELGKTEAKLKVAEAAKIKAQASLLEARFERKKVLVDSNYSKLPESQLNKMFLAAAVAVIEADSELERATEAFNEAKKKLEKFVNDNMKKAQQVYNDARQKYISQLDAAPLAHIASKETNETGDIKQDKNPDNSVKVSRKQNPIKQAQGIMRRAQWYLKLCEKEKAVLDAQKAKEEVAVRDLDVKLRAREEALKVVLEDTAENSKRKVPILNCLEKARTDLMNICWPQTRHDTYINFMGMVSEKLGRDFGDLHTAEYLSSIPATMWTFRWVATLFGVLPEVLTLITIVVVGIPYILWSGFKVDSDTQGMEEIIMATLAVNFIYEIDDAVYDHILPELYKEAHERDRFEISRAWASSDTIAVLETKIKGADLIFVGKGFLLRCYDYWAAFVSSIQACLCAKDFKQTGDKIKITIRYDGIDEKEFNGKVGTAVKKSLQEICTDPDEEYPFRKLSQLQSTQQKTSKVYWAPVKDVLDHKKSLEDNLPWAEQRDMRTIRITSVQVAIQNLCNEAEVCRVVTAMRCSERFSVLRSPMYKAFGNLSTDNVANYPNDAKDKQCEVDSIVLEVSVVLAPTVALEHFTEEWQSNFKKGLAEVAELGSISAVEVSFVEMTMSLLKGEDSSAQFTTEIPISWENKSMLKKFDQKKLEDCLKKALDNFKGAVLQTVSLDVLSESVKKNDNIKTLMRCPPLVCDLLRPTYFLPIQPPTAELEHVDETIPLYISWSVVANSWTSSNGQDLPAEKVSPVPGTDSKKGMKPVPGYSEGMPVHGQSDATLVFATEVAGSGVSAPPAQASEKRGKESEEKEDEKQAYECDFSEKLTRLDELMAEYDKEMAPLTARVALEMSTDEHFNDLYLARAYPFLYARKLEYVMQGHLWERFLIVYGGAGLHYIVLIAMSLTIILGYRHLANCSRFGNSIFSRAEWPDTCLMNVGKTASNFSMLRGVETSEFMAVSCGVNGYVPSVDEWDANSDYFTKT